MFRPDWVFSPNFTQYFSELFVLVDSLKGFEADRAYAKSLLIKVMYANREVEVRRREHVVDPKELSGTYDDVLDLDKDY